MSSSDRPERTVEDTPLAGKVSAGSGSLATNRFLLGSRTDRAVSRPTTYAPPVGTLEPTC